MISSTPRRRVSGLQDSEPKPKPDRRRSALQKRAALRPPMPLTDRRLIRPAAQICDRAALLAELDAALTALADRSDAKAVRATTVAILVRRRTEGIEVIQKGIAEHPLDARPVVRAYAYLTDCLVGAAFLVAVGLEAHQQVVAAAEALHLCLLETAGGQPRAHAVDVRALGVAQFHADAAGEVQGEIEALERDRADRPLRAVAPERGDRLAEADREAQHAHAAAPRHPVVAEFVESHEHAEGDREPEDGTKKFRHYLCSRP